MIACMSLKMLGRALAWINGRVIGQISGGTMMISNKSGIQNVTVCVLWGGSPE